jgi:hypothetical protein
MLKTFARYSRSIVFNLVKIFSKLLNLDWIETCYNFAAFSASTFKSIGNRLGNWLHWLEPITLIVVSFLASVTRWVFEKIAQNVAQLIFVKINSAVYPKIKVPQITCSTCILNYKTTCPKHINNRPID